MIALAACRLMFFGNDLQQNLADIIEKNPVADRSAENHDARSVEENQIPFRHVAHGLFAVSGRSLDGAGIIDGHVAFDVLSQRVVLSRRLALNEFAEIGE